MTFSMKASGHSVGNIIYYVNVNITLPIATLNSVLCLSPRPSAIVDVLNPMASIMAVPRRGPTMNPKLRCRRKEVKEEVKE